MNLLFDTHTLIWFLEGDDNLSRKVKQYIENPEHIKFVSIATFWEIAIKVSLNKLVMRISIDDLKRIIWESSLEVLPITADHALFVSQLPFHHRDPFDRILVAQASIERMTIASKDEALQLYDIQTVW